MNPTSTTTRGSTQCPEAWQSDRLRERRLRNFDRIKAFTEVDQKRVVESSADLSGKDELAAGVMPDQERTEANACTLRIGESADGEVSLRFALHLQPLA